MPDLTFGEQVKIVLGRKGMTIKELAEMIEQRTDKKMSRQNLTQRLGRDNFQEQDMRMIASILECPFRLDILGEDTPDETDQEVDRKETAAIQEADEETVEEEKTDADDQGTESGDAYKDGTDVVTDEDGTTALSDEDMQDESSGRDITVGEFLEIRKSSGESAQEQLMQELLAEMDSIEREDRERNLAWERRRKKREQQEAEKKAEKKGGWMSHLPFRRREEDPKPQEYTEEEYIETDVNEEEIPDTQEVYEEVNEQGESAGSENTFSERLKEYTGPDNDVREQMYEDEEEDLEAGDVNPYTGREYFSNSVRMHPKRIGYVQVYNRKDHKWTDMTEWAFLGYQERKKMLLGKDYEPPIYLD